MFNTLIKISYDGTNYSGFQSQDNAPTIQDALENALRTAYKQPIRVVGAGRTDSGVHARGQAVSYRAPFQIATASIPHALNTLLPPDIVVTAANEMADDFHARFDARGKLYSYTLDCAPFPQVLKRFYSWHHADPIDLDLIRKAGRLFAGTHDFNAFQAAGSSVSDTIRTLSRVEVVEVPEEQLLKIYFEGSGFLYRMVRLITGTLIRAAKQTINEAEIKAALAGTYPAAAGPTAPPHGLCLEEVYYGE